MLSEHAVSAYYNKCIRLVRGDIGVAYSCYKTLGRNVSQKYFYVSELLRRNPSALTVGSTP